MRQVLNEQLRCLDSRLEMHLAMVLELQDFYKRRAEVELEYSRNLDKLVKIAMARHKDEKHRRKSWPGFSTYTCWQTLLASTKRASKDHAIMADVYNGQMVNRFNELMDDMQRIYKECRETGFMCHEELIKVLNELQNAMKTYHIYHGECQQAEVKLKTAESRRLGLEQHASKGTLSRKHKAVEKNAEKRLAKYSEAKKKALKARNDYILCIEGANSAVNKYFRDDIHDLIDCMDCGYHNTIARAMMTHISSEENMIKSRKACLDLMNKCVSELDQRADKQWFLECYNVPFAHPRKIDFQAHKGDEMRELSAQSSVQDDLLGRTTQITQRLTALRLENDEVWKTLETAEKSLMVMINQKDYDLAELFTEENRQPKSPHEHAKKRSDRLETEAFYLKKFRSYLLQNNLITRLQAKQTCIHKALGSGGLNPQARPPSLPPKPKKRHIFRLDIPGGQPKLFGGSIEEYVAATNQDIPTVVRSCIRIINLYGMHHQGLFRVSGSQHEISEFKQAFEKGEDPLEDMIDGRDINSVAGVLKLYFRELKEPLFPTTMFDQFSACCRLKNTDEMVLRLRELMSALSHSVYVVVRYLFAFLAHITEYKDENMMDPYNLAICFGPTLFPIPAGSVDLVVHSNHANELVMNIIQYQDRIFDNEGTDSIYERCILEESEVVEDNDDTVDAASDDEMDVSEALALYDFEGRTNRELTFNKGDTLLVFSRVSNEWWEGACRGQEGLIPDKYITLKNRDEDRGSLSGDDDDASSATGDDTRRSTESLPAKPYATPSPHSGAGGGRGAGGSGAGIHASHLLHIQDSLDKSASHPNISMIASGTAPPSVPPSAAGKQQSKMMKSSRASPSCSPSHSKQSSHESVSDGEQDVVDDPPLTRKAQSADTPTDVSGSGSVLDRSTDELQQDIECALAEVMHGLHSLQLQQVPNAIPAISVPAVAAHNKVPPTRGAAQARAAHTPDLVLDLPLEQAMPITASDKPATERSASAQGTDGNPTSTGGRLATPGGQSSDESPTLSTAEVFAKSNQSTMKKGSSMPRNVSPAMAANLAKLAVNASIKRSHSTAGSVNTARMPRNGGNGSPEKDGSNKNFGAISSPSTVRSKGGIGVTSVKNNSGKGRSVDDSALSDSTTDHQDKDKDTQKGPLMRVQGGRQRPCVPMLTPRRKHTKSADYSDCKLALADGSGSDMLRDSPERHVGGAGSGQSSRSSSDSSQPADTAPPPVSPSPSPSPVADTSRLSTGSDSDHDQLAPPLRPSRSKPKPPLRAKPPIMRKPVSTPSPPPPGDGRRGAGKSPTSSPSPSPTALTAKAATAASGLDKSDSSSKGASHNTEDPSLV